MRKGIKTMLAMLTIASLVMALAACGGETPAPVGEPQTSGNLLDEDKHPDYYEISVYADFSAGSPDANEIKDVFETETEPTIHDVADALSRWSGLDFTLQDARLSGTDAYVVWAADSTLVAGLDNREQKEDFHFYDTVALNWFMMDSLARSIKANFEVEQVFYSQGENQPLVFPDGQGIGLTELPVDQAYEGSAFFVTHADGKGDVMGDEGNETDGRGDVIGGEGGETDGEDLPYWNGLDFGPNLGYAEEYQIQSDPGDYANAAEAAKLTFDALKSGGHIPQYSDSTEYTLVLINIDDIEGESCYIYRLDDIRVVCAYAYQSGNVYYEELGGAWVQSQVKSDANTKSKPEDQGKSEPNLSELSENGPLAVDEKYLVLGNINYGYIIFRADGSVYAEAVNGELEGYYTVDGREISSHLDNGESEVDFVFSIMDKNTLELSNGGNESTKYIREGSL